MTLSDIANYVCNLVNKTDDTSKARCKEFIRQHHENIINSGGETFSEPSIENFRFEPDGSLRIRTWYRIPKHTEDELGDMFKTYLPDNDGKTGGA